MQVRHLLVAASAVAILTGSSFGALAGGYHKSGLELSVSVDATTKHSAHVKFKTKAEAEGNTNFTTWGVGYAQKGDANVSVSDLSIPSLGLSIDHIHVDTEHGSSVAVAAGGVSGCTGYGC